MTLITFSLTTYILYALLLFICRSLLSEEIFKTYPHLKHLRSVTFSAYPKDVAIQKDCEMNGGESVLRMSSNLLRTLSFIDFAVFLDPSLLQIIFLPSISGIKILQKTRDVFLVLSCLLYGGGCILVTNATDDSFACVSR